MHQYNIKDNACFPARPIKVRICREDGRYESSNGAECRLAGWCEHFSHLIQNGLWGQCRFGRKFIGTG